MHLRPEEVRLAASEMQMFAEMHLKHEEVCLAAAEILMNATACRNAPDV
jgi:hypothetical protein